MKLAFTGGPHVSKCQTSLVSSFSVSIKKGKKRTKTQEMYAILLRIMVLDSVCIFFLQILQLLLSHYKKNLMGEKGCFNLRMSRAQLGFEPVFWHFEEIGAVIYYGVPDSSSICSPGNYWVPCAGHCSKVWNFSQNKKERLHPLCKVLGFEKSHIVNNRSNEWIM